MRHRLAATALVVLAGVALSFPATGGILWTDLGATLVHETGAGEDILGGAVKRDDTSSDTLYFKFHVDPLSDASTEEYYAAFQLFEGDTERLGVGNSQSAWAYSAFNTVDTGPFNKVPGDVDLHSSRPERSGTNAFKPYELPRRGIERTIVFKVQYVAGGEDRITVWLNPDLASGATETNQSKEVTTEFNANASFDQIRLRQGGGGGGWTFSDMVVATSFSDFVSPTSLQPGESAPGISRAANSFTFRSWQREQGLPQNSVHAVTQTRDGYLWVGTEDGLARFDGIRFVSFGWREGLRSGPVTHLYEDSRGALWIGSAAGGLTRRDQGQFTSFTIRDGLPGDSITALAEDSTGRLWVGTENGLATWQNGTWTKDKDFQGRVITALFKDAKGTFWLGARGAGLFQLQKEKFVPVSDSSVEALLQDTHCLLVDRADRLWVGVGDDFVLCRETGNWRRYRIPRHLSRPYISALAESPDGSIWAGSVSEGLFQFKEGKLTIITASSGLLDNFVESLLADREGNLWVGTGAGLSQLRPKDLFVFAQNEGLGYGPVQGLAELAPGIIWAAKPGDGLYRWEGRNFGRLNPAGLPRNNFQVNALLTVWDGTCWMGGGNGVLHFKSPKSSPDELDLPLLTGLNVSALAEDRTNGIWAGTRDGQVWRVRNGVAIGMTNLWQPHAINAIILDRTDSIWLASEGSGLTRFKNGNPVHFGKDNGLTSDLIRTLYLDPEGTLWIGTAGGGLARWQNEHVTTFTSRDGLPDDTISQILEDDSGKLWLGSNRGIACVDRHELNELVAGKITVIYPRVFGRAEGMSSEECTGGYCPAGLKIKSGLLWFSTLKGIAVVDPHIRFNESPPPNVVLEEVLIDGVSATAGPLFNHSLTNSLTSLQLPPGNHRLEFRFTGLSFAAPERVRFRYQLEGLDRTWIEAGTARHASYPYLPPGPYQFHVWACNSAGVWNVAGASIALMVMPHFWQAWWFIAVSAVGLLGSVAGTARVVEKRKLQRRLQRAEQEGALERERSRIAQDLHDDLGSSLTRISLLSDLAKADKDNPAQLEQHVEKISQSAAQTVRSLEEIVWAVRPGSDSLQSLVEYIAHFANEMFEGSTTRCRLDLQPDLPPNSLPPDIRHNTFLIVKEALTNARKHSTAREVHVTARTMADSLQITVKDDGQGFQTSAASRETQRNGLSNMRQRAQSIRAALSIESTPNQGTTVKLILPLPAPHA